MAEDKKEKKSEKIISNLKNGTLMKWDTGYGSHRYFLEKENGEEVYLEDIIASLAFRLGEQVEENIKKGIDEPYLAYALDVLTDARRLGI